MDLNFFKNKKKQKEKYENFLKYFKIEQDDSKTDIVADISDEDIRNWLYLVTTFIQKAFSKHPDIKNYLVGDFIIGGQKIEFAFVKDFQEGPHLMRLKLEEENEQLKKRIKELENGC